MGRVTCMARQALILGGFYCSLPDGHPGDHEAYPAHDLKRVRKASWAVVSTRSNTCPDCGTVGLPYVCGSPADRSGGMRCVLTRIIADVSSERDAGHMAEAYNETLTALGLPTIGAV